MSILHWDEKAARRLEATYMTPDIVRQREVTLTLLDLKPGAAVIDIGSGPGFLSESIAATVGPTGRVVGIDISDSLLAAAQRRNKSAHLTYQRGDATRLEFPDASFDIAVSTQVLEYVADCDRALYEMHRVLKAGGRALVVATDWDSVVWHSSDRDRMTAMLRVWEAHCADPRLPRTLGPRLRAAGFKVDLVRGHPIINTRLGADIYSQSVMQMMANFVRKQDGVVDVDGWHSDLHGLNDDNRYFFALTRFMFLATKA